MFTVAQVDGGPVIRISGVIGGGISTVNSVRELPPAHADEVGTRQSLESHAG